MISGSRCVTILRLSALFALPIFSKISSLLEQLTTSTIIRRQQHRKAHFMVLVLVSSNSQHKIPLKLSTRKQPIQNSCSIVPPVSLKTSHVEVPAALQATEDISNSNQLSATAAITKQDALARAL